MESYYNKEEWLEELLDGKDEFYSGNESGDRDNDDEDYNENNEHHQLPEGFVNNCCSTVSSILVQISFNDFALCRHCSVTLVDNVGHGFGN